MHRKFGVFPYIMWYVLVAIFIVLSGTIIRHSEALLNNHMVGGDIKLYRDQLQLLSLWFYILILNPLGLMARQYFGNKDIVHPHNIKFVIITDLNNYVAKKKKLRSHVVVEIIQLMFRLNNLRNIIPDIINSYQLNFCYRIVLKVCI